MSKNILCIGSLSLDVFFPYNELEIKDTPDDTLSKQKVIFEVGAKYRAKNRYDAPGGCATNVSQGLSRLGCKPFLVANVGTDNMGEALVREVESEDVNTDFVLRRQNCKTDLGVIVVEKETGERTILYNRDANESIEFSNDMFEKAEAVFVSGLYGDWCTNISRVRDMARDHACELYYNPSHSNVVDTPEEVWKTCLESSGVFLNKDEAMELLTLLSSGEQPSISIDRTRLESEEYLASVIARNGRERFVVITDGRRGAWAYDRSHDAVFRKEGVSLERVIDSTGAGDSFTSGFLGAILHEKNIETALSWGISNATNVIKYYGAKEGLLDKAKMENLVG